MEQNDDYMNDDPWNVHGVASGKIPCEHSEENESKSYFSAEDLGKISMACGIISFFFYHTLFAILGLVFGIISQSKTKNSSATAGIVCSVITLCIMFLCIIGIIALVLACIPTATEWFDKLKDSLPGMYGF